MKKAGIFAVVISIIMLFMHFYNYRLLAYTDELSFVIDTETAASNLKKEIDEAELKVDELELGLMSYEPKTPVYTRLGGYYISKDFDRLNIKYPVYINDGSRIQSYGDEIEMISSDFSILNTYEGLYIIDGKSYNQDRSQADDEEFIFLKTGDGLFMNVQELKLEIGDQHSDIPSNSLINLKEDSINYYSFENGKYAYNTIAGLEEGRAEIGSVSMLYPDLFARLKNQTKSDKKKDKAEETTAIETEEPDKDSELNIQVQENEEADISDELTSTGDLQDTDKTADGSGNTDKKDTDSTKEDKTESSSGDEGQTEAESLEETDPTHPPYPGKDSNWPFSSGGSDDDDNFASDDDDGEGDGSGSDDSESGGTSGNAEDKFKAPEISLSDFTFGVYNINADIKIENPNQLRIRTIKLSFYKKDDSRVSFRKTIYSQGKTKFKPLRPDTEYEVEGYFDYDHPEYGKTRVEFFPRQYVGKTLPVSSLNPVYMYQEAETRNPSTFSVKINDIKAETYVDGNKIEPDAYNDDNDALMNLAALQISFAKKGISDWQGPEASLSSLIINDLKRGETTEWKSKDILESNSEYEYRIRLYDRFGNEMPTVSTSVLTGSFRTSKQLPKAYITIESKSPIIKKAINVEINNEDNAVFKENSQKTEKPYLYVTYADRPDVPISIKLFGEDEEKTFHVLDGKKEGFHITNLLSNTAYTIWVRASYDCEDGTEHNEEIIGSSSFYTEALSTLGTVNFSFDIENITSESADIEIKKRGMVSESLVPFIEVFEFKITGQDGKTNTFRINKSELSNVKIGPNGEHIYKESASVTGLAYLDPEITIINKADTELSAWDCFFRDGIIKVAFKEKGLDSATRYNVEMTAIGVRGTNVGGQKLEENVTGQNRADRFKTLKKKAYFDYKTSYISVDQASFFGFKIVDPDKAILNDKVVIRLKLANGAEIDARVYSIDELNKMDKLQYTGLDRGASYVISITAAEYNEGYDNTSLEYQKVLYRQDGSTISFKTENTMYGNIVVDRLLTDYEDQSADEGIGVFSANLFDINDCIVDTLIQNNGVLITSNDWLASDFIPVTPGKNYIRGASNNSNTFFYDKDRNLLGRHEYKDTNKYASLVHIPDNAYYVRFNVHIQAASGMYFSEAMFSDEESGGENLLKDIGLTPEKYITQSNGEIIFNSHKDYSYTDKIYVEPERMYARYGTYKPYSANNTVSAVYMFDSNDKLVSTINMGEYYASIVIPEGVSYIRMNVYKGYEDSIYLGLVSEKIHGSNLLNGKAGFKDGYYISANGMETKQGYEYQRVSDYISVVPNSIYNIINVSGFAMYDNNKDFIGYAGRTQSWASGLKVPDNCSYIRVNVDFGTNESNIPELRRGSPRYTEGNMKVSLAVDIHDSEATLGSAPEYFLHYTARDKSGIIVEEDTEKHQIDFDEGRNYYNNLIMPVQSGLNYTFEILIEYGEQQITLSSASVDTGRQANVIKSMAGFFAVRYAPVDNYYVSKDIKLSRDIYIDNFYGHMDFGGYTLSGENISRVFNYIREDAIVENLVADIKVDSENIGNYKGILCNQNDGKLRNIILKIGLNNKAKNNTIGGIIRQNNGVLENFAIQLTDDFSALYQTSPGVSYNYGIIRNGYLLSGNYKILTDMEPSGNRAYRGGLCAINSGSIENVYSVVDIEDTHDESATNTDLMGTVAAASTGGSVKNALGVGVTLSNGQAPVKYGPAVGHGVEGAAGLSNISYVETRDNLNPSRYNNHYNNHASVNSLYDKVWIDNTINSSAAFKTEMIDAGYYPQVIMPDVMNNKQPQQRLPIRSVPSAPEVVSTSVVSNEANKAVIKIGFINRSYLDIKELKLSVLDKAKADGIKNFRKINSDMNIISQGVEEDGVYYVTAEVNSVELYRSQYFIDSFIAGLKGYEDTYQEYDNPAREYSELFMDFYREISTVDEWRQVFLTKNLDEFGNVRIIADELDFSNISESDYTSAYRITSAFKGKIDGAHISEDGQIKNAVIRNMKLGKFYYLFAEYSGVLKNLYFDNIALNTNSNTLDANVGLISVAHGALIENVHVSNSKAVTSYRAGILVSTAKGSTQIVNCSVTDSMIETTKEASNLLSIGGLAGSSDDADILNSFVQGIEIKADEGIESRGIGGLVGRVAIAACSVKNCFAEGKISSMFSYAGGIYGYAEANAVIENNYSIVDLDVYGGFVGGIGGQSGSAQFMRGNLSLGDVFIHSTSLESVHRLFGYLPSDIGDNYAFAGQMFLDGITDKVDDARELLTQEQLAQTETYTVKLNWGDNYAYSWDYNGELQDISQGYMPMLKGTDGSILPNQKPMLITNTDIQLTETTLEINADYVDDYHKLIDQGPVPPGLINPYQLHFVLNYDSSKYRLDLSELSMDGLELNTVINGKNGYEETAKDNRHIFNFHFVKEIFGGDIYCLRVKFTELSTGREIIVTSSVKPAVPISIRIGSADEWNEKLSGEAGRNYPNVIITGNIDFSSTDDAKNVYNVKLNSLTSDGEGPHTIKGIDHVINGSRDSFIREILSRADNVKFDNIKWKVPEDYKTWLSSYTKIGIIGTNSGRISHLEFSNIDINVGVCDSTGCIGYNLGNLSDIKLKDIKVKAEGHNIGGLVGVTKYVVNRITAEGTVTGDLGAENTTYGYEIVGRANVGGICGNGQVNDKISVNGVHVVGNGEWKKLTEKNISAIGGIVGSGSIPGAGGTPSEQRKNGSKISNSLIETMHENPEGTVTTIYGAASGNTYYITADNIIVRSSKGDNVGGISSAAFNFAIKNSSIRAFSNVGGAVGTGQAYTEGHVDKCTVEAYYENAGGIVGKCTTTVSGNFVDRTTVKAPVSAGGILGYNAAGAINNNLVTRSEIKASASNAGGIVGADNGVSAFHMSGNAVVKTKIDARLNPETDNSYAGGIIGYANSTGYVTKNFVRDSEITAEGNCVGGIVGYSEGCQVNNNYFAGSVIETKGSYAGGIIGRLDGDNIVKDSPIESNLYNSYVKGNIKAKSYAGGFIGYYSHNLTENSPELDGNRMYSLIMLGNVESETNGDLIMNIDQSLGYEHQEKYIRIYEHSKLTVGPDGGQITEEAKDKYKDYWHTHKPVDVGGTAATGNEMLKETLIVRGIDLHDGRLYSNAREKGGLNWNGWTTGPSGRMDVEKEGNPAAFPEERPDKKVKLKVSFDDKVEEIPLNTKYYDVKDNTVRATIIEDDGNLYDNYEIKWYRSFGGRYDLVDLAMNDKESIELAGRGYYIAKVHDKDTNKDYYSNIIKVQTKAYMPVLTGLTSSIRGIQEGILPNIGDDDSLINEDRSYNFYDGTDTLYYGGVEIPDEAVTMSMPEAKTEAINIKAYPSGADMVNVELPEDYEDIQILSVYDGDKQLYSGKPQHRVISVKYGFKNILKVNAEAVDEGKTDIPLSSSNAYNGYTETFDPSELRRTVMLCGNDYYYTCNGQLMNSTGVELDRDIIHLFAGQALEADGTIHELSREGSVKLSEEDNALTGSGSENRALYEFEYENRLIKTYGGFTEIYDAESAEAVVQEKQLIVKNDKLYSLEKCDISEGYVVDEYNGLVYASVLNNKSELKDMADHIKTPDGFSRKNIAHMTMNTDSELPYLIVRYKSGEAKGFNYITGEELKLENAFSDISILDFALAHLSELINPSGKENPEFAELRKLKDKLNLNPVDEDKLLMAEELLNSREQTEEDMDNKSDKQSENADTSTDESSDEDKTLDEDLDKDGMADKDGSSNADGSAHANGMEDVSEDTAEDAGSNTAEAENAEESDSANPYNPTADAVDNPGLNESVALENAEGNVDNNTGENAAEISDAETDKTDKPDKADKTEADGSSDKAEAQSIQAKEDTENNESTENKESTEADDTIEKAPEEMQLASAKADNYVYSFNAETGDTEIFNKTELLSKNAGELKSEQEKQKILDAAGIYQEASVLSKTENNRNDNGGMYLFILAILSALGLTFVLVGKKK